jgi:hypothetical protein
VAEWEEWLDADSLIVTISDVQPLAINDPQVLTWPIVVRGVVFKSLWKGCLNALASLKMEISIVCSYR